MVGTSTRTPDVECTEATGRNQRVRVEQEGLAEIQRVLKGSANLVVDSRASRCIGGHDGQQRIAVTAVALAYVTAGAVPKSALMTVACRNFAAPDAI